MITFPTIGQDPWGVDLNTVLAQLSAEYQPDDHNLAAWAYQPPLATGSTVLTGGTVTLSGLKIRKDATINNIYWQIQTIASTVTAGQNFIGIYSSAGTRLVTVNIDAAITSTGLKTTPTGALALTAGMYWVAWVTNASTPPALARGGALAGFADTANVGLTAATMRFATNVAGQTSLPASITPASNVAAISYWSAIG